MMEIIRSKILVSGPSVTDLEVAYAADAARSGWNSHCFDYLRRFGQNAREYLGAPYVIGTSSCTSALHLAVMSLGIGPGDEVIVPESTWIATVEPIVYVGATPVFVDIDERTWTIDPDCILAAITPKTKAICAVHLYGHPADMKRILQIAKDHNLYVIEDAAQSMGGEIDGQKTGTWGDVGCFSFHGSKSVVMGEGGLFVTKHAALYDKAKVIGDHCKHPTIRFYNTGIGYKTQLSNLQAAFGAAQMERVDEIVEKKRQIFSWYQARLGGLPDIQLNTERPGIKNTYWMPTIVLGDSYPIDAAKLSEEMLERNVDTRPFFYPLSTFPMFLKEKRFENPVAQRCSARAINLPSGVELTEDEVDYICAHLKEILTGQKESRPLSGWLLRRETVQKQMDELANDSRYPGLRMVHADYPNNLIELSFDFMAATKDDIGALCDRLEVPAIYLRCRSLKEQIQLETIGFQEVRRTPLVRVGDHLFELSQAEFQVPDQYELLMKWTKRSKHESN